MSCRITNPQALISGSIIARTYSSSLRGSFVTDGALGFVLEPCDEVYTRKSPGTTNRQNVNIEDEVVLAGDYTLTSRKMCLNDIYKATDGVAELGYVKGVRLECRPTPSERIRMENIHKVQLEQQHKNMVNSVVKTKDVGILQTTQEDNKKLEEKFKVPDAYPVSIELDKTTANPGSDADITLREGGHTVIPQYGGTVKISGAVMFPNSVGYAEGKSVAYYINRAGGFANDAEKSNTYTLYMNGMLVKIGHNTRMHPGCETIASTKIQSKISLAETLSIGLSAAGIAAVIAMTVNLLRQENNYQV